MFSAAIITFREVLEIAIILSIIMAATRGLPGRNRWVGLGLLGGVMGALLVAVFADSIASSLEGSGQEIFNGVILLIAVLMIGWTVIWMQRHGREMAQHLKRVGHEVRDGVKPLYALAVVVSLAMWREGAEIALFLYGIVSSGQESAVSVAIGGLAGGATAAVVGVLMYFGLLRIPVKHFFAVTSGLLILLACGISAQAAGFFVAAGLLPELVPVLWDSSALLSQSSALGRILHALLGYTERPSGMQLCFYLVTLGVILVLERIIKKKTLRPAASAVVALTAVAIFAQAEPAKADFKIYSPRVEYRMLEVESRNRVDFDHRSGTDLFRQHKLGVGYGFTPWWFSEIYGELEKEQGHGYQYTATEWENLFQFTEPGQYWLDAGGLVEYERSHEAGGADELSGKLLLEKTINRFVHTANIGLEREVGEHRSGSTEFNFSWRSAYAVGERTSLGVEYFGNWNEIKHTGDYNAQQHRFGPVLFGSLPYVPGVKYELGYLLGISQSAQDHTVKLNLEYEFPL